MGPILIPFAAEHLLAFVNRDSVTREDWRLAVEKERRGPAYTGIVGEIILGSAGIILMWPGVGAAWMVLSP